MTEELLSSRQANHSVPKVNRLDRPLVSQRRSAEATTNYSINEMTTYRWSFSRDVTEYRDAGLEAIGVWRPKLVEFGEERGVELIRDSGLSVSSLSWAGGFTGANGHSFDEAVDDAWDALELAGQLEARSLVIVSGARSGHILRHARRLVVDGLKSLIPFSEEVGVPLALQPMHRFFDRDWTFLNTLDETLQVLDECRSPQVQIAFDVYHLWQEPRLIDRIAELASRTAVVQLSDWREPPRSDSDRCLPGDGVIPLGDIVSAFLQAGYRGGFELNVWSDEVWHSEYRPLLERCRRRFEELCAPQRRFEPADVL